MDRVLFTISGNSVITLVALLTAIFAIWRYLKKGVNWVDGMNTLDSKIKKLEEKHDQDVKAIKEEQTLAVYGILACLKAIDKQGADPSVQDAIDKIEKHLNKEAHR